VTPPRACDLQALIDTKLSASDKDEELWEEGWLRFPDQLLLLGSISRVLRRAKERSCTPSIGKNFGFTDIIIGRKHADAPYDMARIFGRPGRPAQIRRTQGRPENQARQGRFAAFYEELGRLACDDCAPRVTNRFDQRPRFARETPGRCGCPILAYATEPLRF